MFAHQCDDYERDEGFSSTSTSALFERRIRLSKRKSSYEYTAPQNEPLSLDSLPTSTDENSWSSEFNIQVEFKQRFECEYARNNKACGVKNIRCFPSCSACGHVVQGFCGQVVEVSCSAISRVGGPKISDMLVIGEFQPHGREFEGIADGLHESEIMRNAISQNPRYHLGKKKILTECEKDGERREEFVLTFEAKPWQYNWTNNKHKNSTEHGFFVSFLLPRSALEKNSDCGSELKVIFQQSSPTFRIKSVRKRNITSCNAMEEDFEASYSTSAALKPSKPTRPRRTAPAAKKRETLKRKVAKVSPATSLEEDSNWSSDSDTETLRPSSNYHRLPISHCDLSPNLRNRIAMDKAFSSEQALLQDTGELVDVSFGEDFDENFYFALTSPVSSFQPLVDVQSEPQPSRAALEQTQTRSLPLFANLQQNLQNTLHRLPFSDALKQVSMLKKLFPNLDVSATLRGQTLDELSAHHC